MTNLECVAPFHWSSVSTRVVGARLAKRLDLTTARALEIPRAILADSEKMEESMTSGELIGLLVLLVIVFVVAERGYLFKLFRCDPWSKHDKGGDG